MLICAVHIVVVFFIFVATVSAYAFAARIRIDEITRKLSVNELDVDLSADRYETLALL